MRRVRGFTLVEVLTASAVVGVLAGVALPSYRGQVVRAQRIDAVSALTRLQVAQERLRGTTGLYSDSLATLRVGERSDEGLYTLAVELTGPDSWRASATRSKADDAECPLLTLEVKDGFAQVGPSTRCWNR